MKVIRYFLILIVALSLTTVLVFLHRTKLFQQKIYKNKAQLRFEESTTTMAWKLQVKPYENNQTKHQYISKFVVEPDVVFNSSCDHSCSLHNSYRWTMVMFIKSTADNFSRRQFVRRTWGAVRYTSDGRVRVVFVLELSESRRTRQQVLEEAQRYHDILVYRGAGNYKNIARKTLAGMQWASERLPAHYLYSSGDDDIIVDMSAVDQAVNHARATRTRRSWPIFPISCGYALVTDPLVIRHPKNKNQVPRDAYPWDQWPRACLGAFYTTSVELITGLWRLAAQEKMIDMDDVWITGILRQKLGVPDYVVLQLPKPSALHFDDYLSHGDPSTPSFMWNEWRSAYKTISAQPHCMCSPNHYTTV